jgi:hypothetical protein
VSKFISSLLCVSIFDVSTINHSQQESKLLGEEFRLVWNKGNLWVRVDRMLCTILQSEADKAHTVHRNPTFRIFGIECPLHTTKYGKVSSFLI